MYNFIYLLPLILDQTFGAY